MLCQRAADRRTGTGTWLRQTCQAHTKRIVSLNTTIAALVVDYLELVELVVVADISPAVSADSDDDALLATALAAGAEMIVSGDAHLLNLKHYQVIPIVTAAECLRRLGTEPSEQK